MLGTGLGSQISVKSSFFLDAVVLSSQETSRRHQIELPRVSDFFIYINLLIEVLCMERLLNLKSFVAEPRLDEFNGLKKLDLLQVGQYYKLLVNTYMSKGDIKKVVLNFLIEEEIFPEDDLECTSVSGEQSLELRRLEYQGRDKA